MKVYRYLSEEELLNITNSKLELLGNTFVQGEKERRNTHKYKHGVKYLHFFKNQDSIENIRKLYKNLKGNFYICTFEIPAIKLLFRGGNGFYTAQGYDLDFNVEKEYAIETKNFNTSWLKEYKLDNRKQAPAQEIKEDYQQ